MALGRANAPTLQGFLARTVRAPVHFLTACFLVFGLVGQLAAAAACATGTVATSPLAGVGGPGAFPICHAQTVDDHASGGHDDRSPSHHDAPCPFCSTCCHAVSLPATFAPVTAPIATAEETRSADAPTGATFRVRIAALPRGPPARA